MEGSVEKTIVCFGDSNTWGFNPATGGRFNEQIRWPRRMQRRLGAGFNVVEEGLNGRTTVFEDPISGGKNGFDHLPIIRKTHMPIDVLVIMLGTNDLQFRFAVNAAGIAKAMSRLVFAALQPTDDVEGRAPQVLLVAPPPIGPLDDTPYEALFNGEVTRAQSRQLAPLYKDIAQLYGTAFFDAGSAVSVSPLDAIHIDEAMQGPLADALAQEVARLF